MSWTLRTEVGVPEVGRGQGGEKKQGQKPPSYDDQERGRMSM